MEIYFINQTKTVQGKDINVIVLQKCYIFFLCCGCEHQPGGRLRTGATVVIARCKVDCSSSDKTVLIKQFAKKFVKYFL